ncbi:MAG: BACON domain-containing protein, partial [Bacteroidales bacterium]|nr:BACON domain-containing protein [Bacteroidales bacterium]
FVEPAGLVLNFGPEESSANVTFVCTRDWNISEVLSNTLPDWIALSATSGEASTKEQSVTVTVMENPGNDRETTITFTIGLAKAALTVKQEGKLGGINPGTGTKEDPYSVAAALEYIATLGADVQSSNSIYVKGIISDVATTFEASGNYGNASFYMVDTEGSEDRFYAFQTYYLGNRKWKSGDTDVKAGDQVIICGPVVNYKGNTPETVGKGASYIYSLNGKTEGGAGGDDTDYSKVPAKTVKEFIAAADTQNYYKLTGKVSNFNSNYCSFDLTDETGSIYVYSVDNKADWSSKVANGGTVSLAGKYAFYAAKEQHEVVNAYILTFEGSGNTGNDDTPTGNGTLESPYNPKAAYDAAAQLEKDAKSENDVYIAGVISSIKYTFSAQYGTATFNISEDGTTNGTQFPCYSVLYLGNRAWVEGDTQVAVGDRVVICGKITNYGGNTPETASKLAYIYSLNGQTTIEQGPVFGVEKTEINVAATATGAVIKVTGNVPWTATSTAIIEGGSVSGNGAGEFSVAFDPNTDTENTKVYTATVVTTADVANKEIRVTITQAKASSGSGTHYEVQWLQEALAAAPAGGAVNQMDDVISFINSSSYGSTVPTELRIYKNQTLTIKAAAGYTIEDIEIGCTAAGEEKYGPGCFTVTPDGYTFNDKSGRWAGDAQEVVFTAATNQVRIVDLKVHYKN